jgi:hypothetical protein
LEYAKKEKKMSERLQMLDQCDLRRGERERGREGERERGREGERERGREGERERGASSSVIMSERMRMCV